MKEKNIKVLINGKRFSQQDMNVWKKSRLKKSIQNFTYKNSTKCNVIRDEQEINKDKSSIF